MTDPTDFVEELARQIAAVLREGGADLREHRLGALALEAAPWHRAMGLSILIDTDAARKWDMGAWEFQTFAEVGQGPRMEQGYDDLREPGVEGSRAYHPFFRCCARALCHAAVQEALKDYRLEADFELFVADPDDPNEVNFCEEILGVDLTKRKPKTEIVNNLPEALKDPESVRTLKYWYQERLTREANEQIALLSNLEDLQLPSMGLDELPSCVRSLRKLTKLNVSSNRLRRLDGLEILQDLRVLCLNDNEILTPEMAGLISKLPHLRQLYVGNCGMTEVPPPWQRLQLLEEINLSENPLSTVPAWLPALPKLKLLVLRDAVDEPTRTLLAQSFPSLKVV